MALEKMTVNSQDVRVGDVVEIGGINLLIEGTKQLSALCDLAPRGGLNLTVTRDVPVEPKVGEVWLDSSLNVYLVSAGFWGRGIVMWKLSESPVMYAHKQYWEEEEGVVFTGPARSAKASGEPFNWIEQPERLAVSSTWN